VRHTCDIRSSEEIRDRRLIVRLWSPEKPTRAKTFVGTTPDIAELCLGHALKGMRKVYDHHLYEPEKRAAMEKLSAFGSRDCFQLDC
jgi:integrase